MGVVFDKQAYDSRRASRRYAQQVQLSTVLGLPEDERAAALMNAWPQKLPKKVKSKLPKRTLSAYRELSEERWMAALVKLGLGEHPAISQERLNRAVTQAMVAHCAAIDIVLSTIASIQDTKTLTVAFDDPLAAETGDADREMTATFVMLSNGTVTDGYGEPDEHGLRAALGLGLSSTGSVVIRQHLALRVQRKDENGNMVWKPQERVYGAALQEGKWEPLSAKQICYSFSVDAATGQPITPAAGTSFGDLIDVARRTRPKGTAVH